MLRNHVTARLGRYRYEIAAALFLTIVAVALLAMTSLNFFGERSLSEGIRFQSPAKNSDALN
jgi:ABC-type Fe3+ transport system permease subunit